MYRNRPRQVHSRRHPRTNTNSTQRKACLSNKFWNIFERRRPIRISVVVGLGLSTVVSLVLLPFSNSHLTIVRTVEHPLAVSTGCIVYPPRSFWITYTPLLLFHVCSKSFGFVYRCQGQFWRIDINNRVICIHWQYMLAFLIGTSGSPLNRQEKYFGSE
jgi:hypothetical protein